MSGRFQGRIALVTGAASGIGAACARLLGQGGAAALVLLDLSRDGLAAVAAGLPQERVSACVADVADREALGLALRPVLARLGRVDIVVHCAALSATQPADDVATWHRVIDVNLHGAYHVALEALACMPDGGRIIQVSSALGRVGQARSAAYCASKHGLLGLTRSLALDLAPRCITVNAVLPACVETPMYESTLRDEAVRMGLPPGLLRQMALDGLPLQRFVQAGEVAALIGFLVSEEGAGVTAQAYVIDGGVLMGLA